MLKPSGCGVKFHAMGKDGCGSLCGKVPILNLDTKQPIESVPTILRCRKCWPNDPDQRPGESPKTL